MKYHCQYYIASKKRKCKKTISSYNYCKQHYNLQYYNANDQNTCCFCGMECNPNSQCCGICARQLLFRKN